MNDRTRSALLQSVVADGMLDFQRITTLCHLLLQTQPLVGAVCEFGVYKGMTAALMASLTSKEVWLYDSFDGLSQPGPHDGQHENYQLGAMKVGPSEALDRFDNLSLPEPKLIIKEFKYLSIADLPDTIAFAHVDADLHAGTLKVIELIWPFMSLGGIVVIDDYRHPALPGVSKAVNEFCMVRGIKINEPWSISGASSLACYLQR